MIRHLWQRHRLAVLAFAVALCALGYFGIKTVTSTIYWMDPAHRDQPLAGWMTPRYVAQSYGLPPEVLGDALFLAPGQPKRISLDAIMDGHSLTLDDLQARIEAAAATFRATRDVRRND